jgi:hypothetical protein
VPKDASGVAFLELARRRADGIEETTISLPTAELPVLSALVESRVVDASAAARGKRREERDEGARGGGAMSP